MSKFKNQNFNFSNLRPQHPAAHGVLRAITFTKNKIIKNIAKRNFFSDNSLTTLSLNEAKKSKISKTHINEFLTIIDSFKKNPRQSRLINSNEIIDYYIQNSNGLNSVFISVVGIWFQNSETKKWSILIIEENSKIFENHQNLIYLNLIGKIIDISSLPKYNFSYNDKTYEMDGTISYDSMNEIINKIDSNLVLKFLENISGKTNNSIITDFDKFITIIILNNHKTVSSNGNSSRLCGIILPALFSNKARYQIYSFPTIFIKSHKSINNLENVDFDSFLQFPAPISEETRIPHHSTCPGGEIDFDGSIPVSLLNKKFQQDSKFYQNFISIKYLAEIQNIKHINLDWIIFMLLTIIKFDDFLFSEIIKKSELSSSDIIDTVGYHLPVYYCMTDFNEYLNNREIQFNETQKEFKKLLSTNYNVSKI